MSYLGKLGNLSDMNHITILFLPNLLKQVKKEGKNLYWIEIQSKFIPVHLM